MNARLSSRRERWQRRRQESGYAAVVVAIFAATLLFPLSALAVDVSRWYVEVERVQAAADAASMAGVTYLPNDFASATATAKTVSARNGYPDGGTSTVTVQVGDKPTQLKVTVSSTVRNGVAAAFSNSFTTVSRSAVADYNGPVPMGSPCNTFGNEPPGTNARGPVGSQLVIPSGGANCSTTPRFWAGVEGPNVYKTQGDQLSTRYCKGYESGCDSSNNNQEFDPKGYFYIIRVNPGAVGSPVTLQLYDPIYAPTGGYCSTWSGTISSNNWNDYANTDAITRYPKSSNDFCSGDDASSGNRVGSETPTVTSFGLRQPVDTNMPETAPPIAGCAKQYPGFSTSQVTSNALRKGNSSYNDQLASMFHQWVTFCTFTPTKAGDYYLQVRSNVPLQTGSQDAYGAYTGSNKVYTQTGDDTSVKSNGNNMFAMRAISANAGALSIAGWDQMAIFANAPTSVSTFNLVRVVPAAAQKTLVFSFFDAGDAASGSGSIQVLPPTETSISLNNCKAVGYYNGNLTNCKINGVSGSSGWNGQYQKIKVPIPATYNCNVYSAGGCWWRVVVDFGSASSVTDFTTWSANIEGDPIRLIK